jgi:hypothetical protein
MGTDGQTGRHEHGTRKHGPKTARPGLPRARAGTARPRARARAGSRTRQHGTGTARSSGRHGLGPLHQPVRGTGAVGSLPQAISSVHFFLLRGRVVLVLVPGCSCSCCRATVPSGTAQHTPDLAGSCLYWEAGMVARQARHSRHACQIVPVLNRARAATCRSVLVPCGPFGHL